MIWAFFGRTEPNQTQKVRPAHMIWPDSGCTLALTAMVKMLLNWIWHVYHIFPLPLHLPTANVGGVEEVKLFDLLDDPGFQSFQVLKVGALDLTVVVKVDEGNVLLMCRRLVVVLGRKDTAGEGRQTTAYRIEHPDTNQIWQQRNGAVSTTARAGLHAWLKQFRFLRSVPWFWWGHIENCVQTWTSRHKPNLTAVGWGCVHYTWPLPPPPCVYIRM